ncbi:MAG: ATP-binding protein [Steroidobacteraceae bacterium]
MAFTLLVAAAVMQGLAVLYGIHLLSRRQGASGAWLLLLGAMCSMLAWRIAVVSGVELPGFFNPLIAIWGSSCMVGAMFLFGREVAARRAAEQQRDALLGRERLARAEAERANRLKDEFLATLSHELRSPLAAILGWSAVLRRSSPPRAEDVERALEVIERNARLQAGLVEDLLDVTRLQAGALHLELENLALEAPVRAAVQAARPLAEARAIRLELRAPAVSPRVRGDATRLQQVVGNLVGNAVKFTPQGGRIEVRLEELPDRARLMVADDGEGIEPDFLPFVFERFRQADGTSTRRHGGLGLGLSIVQQLVRLHGGEIVVASAGRDRGTTFTVTLPLAAAPAPRAVREVAAVAGVAAHDPAVAGGRIAGAALAGVRLLLVDDEADVRAAIGLLLTQAGAEVVALESGADIEQALQRHRPDVLLMDIGMPGEDGYGVIERVRRLPASAGGATPAISLTAHARNEDRARALAAGFDGHLPKPIEVVALLEAIQARLHAAEAPPAAMA